MATNIRKSLGPIRKRLKDRIKEVFEVLNKDDVEVSTLRYLRSKITANIKTHDQVYDKLNGLQDLGAEDKEIVENEIEISTMLNLDANEALQTVIEYINDMGTTRETKNLELEQQKELLEIENLKLDNDCKKAELDKLTIRKMEKDAPRDSHDTQRIRLPEIPLPTFSGKIVEWPSFWDSFNSTIHSNQRVSKVDKFKYLMAQLEGDAKSTLRGFELTENHYDEAVELLKERYDDAEHIIHHHYKILSRIPRSSDETSDLRKTFNLLESQVRSLQCMGEVVENNYMVSLFKSKLPETFNLRLEENRDSKWTLQLLRKSANKLILAREKSEETIRDQVKPPEFLYTGEGLLSNNTKVKCCFCEKSHWSDECQEFKTVKDRKSHMRGRCFICLGTTHLYRDCLSKKPCFYCKEKGQHHSSLCVNKFGDPGLDPASDTAVLGEELELNLNQDVIMKTAKVIVYDPVMGRSRNIIALMDSGAKRTYLTEEVADIIRIKRGPSKVTMLNTFSTNTSSRMLTSQANIVVEQKDGSKKLMQVNVCKTITGSLVRQKLDVGRYRNVWNHLEMADDIPQKSSRFHVDLLIGNDYYDDIMKSDKIHLGSGLYLINSTFGWMFSGRVTSPNINPEAETSMIADEIDIARKAWELETIGIQNVSDEDEMNEYTNNFKSTIQRIKSRYRVGLTWRLSKYELSDNYKLAKARLKSVIQSISKDTDPDLLMKYDQIIKKQMSDGISEEAITTPQYLQDSAVVVHYIPHHLIKGGDKLRIVYDGSAKTNISKKSLNECLYKGTNTVKDLCGTILRFHLDPVALTADIEQAYLQMELEMNDRDVTRFLWLRDIHKPLSEDNMIELRFCRVIWGIVCAAFLLGNTISYHLDQYKSKVAKDIDRNLYVDNLVSGAKSTKDAISYYHETKEIFNNACMNMRKWVSNDEEVMKNIKVEDKCSDKKVKVLGMIWDVESDEMALATYKVPHTQPVTTKRIVAQAIASVYDPVGTRCPVLLQPKILLQELWEQCVGWDENVPEAISNRWLKYLKDIREIHSISTPRCVDVIKDDGKKHYQLLTFTDASKHAYSAAVYLKITNGTMSDVNLIFAKTRLRPIKRILTIPRLELMGVLIGCRMSNYVTSQLDIKISRQTLYTDSKCVLEWVKSSKSLKRFVMDRVNEIQSYEINLKYVKSEENPADIATRGVCVEELKKRRVWWKGPEWASSACDTDLQIYELNDETRAALVEEMKSNRIVSETGLVAGDAVETSGPFGIDETKYSQFHRLIRVTSWCYRFIYNAQIRKRENKVDCFLTGTELCQSTHVWTKFIQEKHFQDVSRAIENNKSHNLIGLGLYKDKKGILRCSGRFQSSKNHPQLLPKNGHFTELVIKRYHELCLHGGVAQTLAYVRKEFWIIQARSSVRKMIRKCLTCIRWQGGPFRTPHFSPYPSYVTDGYSHPFTHTGLDYLGPIGAGNVEVSKHWIVLFTCINTRAVHLELVFDMTGNEFLLAMRRFIGRRGNPKLIISDNGSQIKLGNEILGKIWKTVLKNEEMLSYTSERGITWKYIIQYAPWKGGFYERLVGLTKNTLKKTLGRSKLNQTQLLTTLVEVEAVLNSRPLTYIGDDITSGHCITPAHFTSVNCKIGFPDYDNEDEFYNEDNTYLEMLESWKGGNRILNNFWKIWLLEYLPALTQRKMLAMKRPKGVVDRSPSIGEIVIIKEENLPRGRWKMGKIIELIRGEADGVERAAKLITSTRKCVKRPLCYLYPLECNREEVNHSTTEPTEDNITQHDTKRRELPKRAAAVDARKRIQDQTE